VHDQQDLAERVQIDVERAYDGLAGAVPNLERAAEQRRVVVLEAGR
jgi:hypothetical protein